MTVDEVFWPRLRRVDTSRPIVIVGNPRTGTTFLQRFLAENGVGSGQILGRMLFPSIFLQKILRPFLPTLDAISPARHHATAAHDTNLQSVETDDVSVLFRYFDGFFLYGFFLAFAEEDYIGMFEPSQRDTSERDFAWLDRIWRRGMILDQRDRVVAKLFSLGPRAGQFLSRYPEARLLYMVRDPLETIPSGMSLLTGVLHARFKFWDLPKPVRDRYLERLYKALVELMRRWDDDYQSGKIRKDRVMFVRYDRMMQDFDGLMGELLAFVGHTPDAAFTAEIQKIAEKQRAYKSGHKYDLQKFGLDAERIRRDCAFVYERYLGEPVVMASTLPAPAR